MDEQRYTCKEIAASTGIKATTLKSRALKLRKAGLLPPIKNKVEASYTYDEVKLIVKAPPRRNGPHRVRKHVVDALRMKLLNDGYPIRKGETK